MILRFAKYLLLLGEAKMGLAFLMAFTANVTG
jgi:hypothetical protein